MMEWSRLCGRRGMGIHINCMHGLCTLTLSGQGINKPIAGRIGRLFTCLQDTLIITTLPRSSKCHLLMSLQKLSVFFFLLIAWVVIINMIRSIQNLHCQTSRLLVCQGHAGLWGEPLGLISTFVTAWTFTITGEKLDGCNETRD